MSIRRSLEQIVLNGHGLKKVVAAEALNERTSEEEVISFFRELQTHGCISGMVPSLVYYFDTHAFFQKHYNEIEHLRQEIEEMFGKPLKPEGDLMNWYAWFAFEETALRLYNEIVSPTLERSTEGSIHRLPMVREQQESYEVGIRYKRPLYNKMPLIDSPNKAADHFRFFIDNELIDYKEAFLVMLLTNANKVLGMATIGIGTSTGVQVFVREIWQLALMTNSSGIIICHNHPSGKLEFSKADCQLTEKIINGAKLLEFTLLDHIILTKESFVSWSEIKSKPSF